MQEPLVFNSYGVTIFLASANDRLNRYYPQVKSLSELQQKNRAPKIAWQAFF
jgi:hypothetical protein